MADLVDLGQQFSGLPMDTLIVAPLKAACDAQITLANATANFINTVGFDQNNNTRTATFTYTRQTLVPDSQGNQTAQKENVAIDVPLIAIVNVPNLMIDSVDIVFDMEVKSSFQEQASTDKSGSFSGKGQVGFGPFSATVSIHGQVATHREQTRSSDNSAKYHIEVTAKQASTPEGLSRVLDMMNQAIAAAPYTPPASQQEPQQPK